MLTSASPRRGVDTLVRFLQWKFGITRSLGLTNFVCYKCQIFCLLCQIFCYTGRPRKNATTLIVNFLNIVDETEFFFFFLVEY